jgi:hypothetical protein
MEHIRWRMETKEIENSEKRHVDTGANMSYHQVGSKGSQPIERDQDKPRTTEVKHMGTPVVGRLGIARKTDATACSVCSAHSIFLPVPPTFAPKKIGREKKKRKTTSKETGNAEFLRYPII